MAPQPTRNSSDPTLLDNPAWHALGGPHARFAETLGAARRYQPEVSFAHAIENPADPADAAWADLAKLVGPGTELTMTGLHVDAPASWEVVGSGHGYQMIDVAVDAAPDEEAVVLGADDVPEMLDLVARAQPGPFFPRTYEMGTYLGLRDEGRLVAMAGERVHPPGWTEISAVATEEAHRGRGLAGRLVRAVAYNIRSRGEQPLLHVAEHNDNARRLYLKLGFEVRVRSTFVRLRTPE